MTRFDGDPDELRRIVKRQRVVVMSVAVVLGAVAGAYVGQEHHWIWATATGITVGVALYLNAGWINRQRIRWAEQARADGIEWRWVRGAETDISLVELLLVSAGIASLMVAFEYLSGAEVDRTYMILTVVVVGLVVNQLLAARRVRRLFDSGVGRHSSTERE